MNYSFVMVDRASSKGSAKDFNFKIHNKSTTIQAIRLNFLKEINTSVARMHSVYQ